MCKQCKWGDVPAAGYKVKFMSKAFVHSVEVHMKKTRS